MDRKVDNNYVYQPLPADKEPYCFAVGGIDVNFNEDFKKSFYGIKKEEAIKKMLNFEKQDLRRKNCRLFYNKTIRVYVTPNKNRK